MQLSPFGILFSSALLDFTLLSIVKGSLPVTEGNKDSEHFIYMNSCPSKEQSSAVLALCQYPPLLPPTREAFWIRVLHCDTYISFNHPSLQLCQVALKNVSLP